MQVTSSLLLSAVAAIALVAGPPAAAQTWTAQPASDAWDAAAIAQWDSGVAMVARCHEGNFRLFSVLVSPMGGTVATVEYAFDDEEPQTVLSALTSTGEAVSVRHPVSFARMLLSAESLDMTITADGSPPQRYVLDVPDETGILEEVLVACGQTASEADTGSVWTAPTWIRRPSASDLLKYYPPEAFAARVSGRATIECVVTAQGQLEDCLPIAEEPVGHGFAAASLAATSEYRIRPALLDGRPIGGAVVHLPYSWDVIGPRECYRGSGPVACTPDRSGR